MAEEPKLSELITMRQAARYCDRSHGRVRSYVQSGRLKAWKLGKLWVTTKKEVDRFFEARNEKWLSLPYRMTKFAKIRAEHHCEYCGRPEGFKVRCHVLTVYHLDGDDNNWEPKNVAICWVCYWYLQEHCHQLPLPGIEHPLDRLRQLRR